MELKCRLYSFIIRGFMRKNGVYCLGVTGIFNRVPPFSGVQHDFKFNLKSPNTAWGLESMDITDCWVSSLEMHHLFTAATFLSSLLNTSGPFRWQPDVFIPSHCLRHVWNVILWIMTAPFLLQNFSLPTVLIWLCLGFIRLTNLTPELVFSLKHPSCSWRFSVVCTLL